MRYVYRCANQHVTEKICPAWLYEEAVACDACDLVAQRLWTPPIHVSASMEVRYDSPIDGRPVTTRYQRQEEMKRHGKMEYDPEMKTDADRRRRESQQALEAAVEETVNEEIAKMSTAKRGKLYSELTEQGVDLTTVRGTYGH